MEQLRKILLGDMDAYDLRLMELNAMLTMAENAVEASNKETIVQVFAHAQNCVTNLRAELEDMRGTMVSLLTEMKESA